MINLYNEIIIPKIIFIYLRLNKFLFFLHIRINIYIEYRSILGYRIF